MGKFIGYTVGLECFVEDRGIQMVKIEYSEAPDGVKLQAVSGRNLGAFARRISKKISRDEFDNRPAGNIEQAIWAMGLVGLRPAGLSGE